MTERDLLNQAMQRIVDLEREMKLALDALVSHSRELDSVGKKLDILRTQMETLLAQAWTIKKEEK